MVRVKLVFAWLSISKPHLVSLSILTIYHNQHFVSKCTSCSFSGCDPHCPVSVFICFSYSNSYQTECILPFESSDVMHFWQQFAFPEVTNDCQFWRLHSSSSAPKPPHAVNPFKNSYKPHMLINYSSLTTFLSLTAKAHVLSVTHGQLRKQQHMYVRLAALKSHFKLNMAFKVSQGHPFWCRQKSKMVCYHNVQCRIADVISQTYQDIATGKLQIHRFQRPHSGLTTILTETSPNIYKRFIHYCQKLE